MKGKVAVLLLLPYLAGAVPEADPEPEAQNMMYGPGLGPGPVPGPQGGIINGLPPYGPSSFADPCGMAAQCCSASEECCMGEQKCYYKWEQKCGTQSQPFCRSNSRRFCAPYTIKSCRMANKQFKYDLPMTQCTMKRERKCFPYQKEVCDEQEKELTVSFKWTDQELVGRGDSTKEECIDVKTCNIVMDNTTITRRVPEQRCRTVPDPRRECRTVSVPQPPQPVTKVVFEIEYRTQCVQVPKVKCEQQTCETGYCYQGQDVCSTTQVEARDICDPCIDNNYCVENRCQQVQVPMCVTGMACQTGSQQCCRTEYERVCSQVPIKVPRTVTETYQPPPKYEVKCELIPQDRKECRWEMVPKEYTVPIKRCKEATENKCFNYQVPDQNMIETPRSEEKTFRYSECNIKTVDDTHCVTLDVGVDCQTRDISKKVYRPQRICDQELKQKACFDVPYSECSGGTGVGCQWVPRKVCQNTCPQTDRCTRCTQFVGSGGYSACPTNQCSSYIGRDAVNGNVNMFDNQNLNMFNAPNTKTP